MFEILEHLPYIHKNNAFLIETVEGADEQKAPEPEGEPADQNANAVDGQQEEATEGQEKQEAETEQTEQAKEGEEGEGEGKEEEPKQEGNTENFLLLKRGQNSDPYCLLPCLW